MKQVILSIRPKWVEKILNGEKTIEVRKQKPNCEVPFKVYIYCTKGNNDLVYGQSHPLIPERYELVHGRSREESKNIYETLNQKIVGEFVCDRIQDFSKFEPSYDALLRHIDLYAGTNKDYMFLDKYLQGKKQGYAWNISDLKIYEEPKELSQFSCSCVHKIGENECNYKNVKCSNQVFDFNEDNSVNCVECSKTIKTAPQSYCFTEGELDG